MAGDFVPVFEALKTVLAKHQKRLAVKTDTPTEYTMVTRVPSPYPQHKGHPMFFGSVRIGKAYVSLHLLPIYMCEPLIKTISPELLKRMQGKACFNFKAVPEPAVARELKTLTLACLKAWEEKKWL